MNRREFLGSVAALAAGGSLPAESQPVATYRIVGSKWLPVDGEMKLVKCVITRQCLPVPRNLLTEVHQIIKTHFRGDSLACGGNNTMPATPAAIPAATTSRAPAGTATAPSTAS